MSEPKIIPKSFDYIPNFHCPAEFWPALGYNGNARFVAIYWEQAGDEASYHDGRHGLCGANWQAYLLLLNTNFPIAHPPAPARRHTGSSDSQATHWIVIDRQEPRAWLAPWRDAEIFLHEQWPRMPQAAVASVDKMIDQVLATMREYEPPAAADIAAMMKIERQQLAALRLALVEK